MVPGPDPRSRKAQAPSIAWYLSAQWFYVCRKSLQQARKVQSHTEEHLQHQISGHSPEEVYTNHRIKMVKQKVAIDSPLSNPRGIQADHVHADSGDHWQFESAAVTWSGESVVKA